MRRLVLAVGALAMAVVIYGPALPASAIPGTAFVGGACTGSLTITITSGSLSLTPSVIQGSSGGGGSCTDTNFPTNLSNPMGFGSTGLGSAPNPVTCAAGLFSSGSGTFSIINDPKVNFFGQPTEFVINGGAITMVMGDNIHFLMIAELIPTSPSALAYEQTCLTGAPLPPSITYTAVIVYEDPTVTID